MEKTLVWFLQTNYESELYTFRQSNPLHLAYPSLSANEIASSVYSDSLTSIL